MVVNLVALWLVFIGALAGFDPPLNAVQLLWVNLVMDTMGALALGTEPPTPELLQRKPYKRSAPLISWPMRRNILVQGTFQLILLLILLFNGAKWFGVAHGNACAKYKLTSSPATWDLTTGHLDATNGSFTCARYNDFCHGEGTLCLDRIHIDPNTLISFRFNHLEDFESTCLECTKEDYTHYSIIFNAFIFC